MDYTFLSTTRLFDGIREEEIQGLMGCLHGHEKTYKKNESIYTAGKSIHEIGLVEEGSVNVVVNFYWGDSNIFSHIEKGSIFGENYAAIPGKELVCDIVAQEETKVLFLDFSNILTACKNTCAFHNRLIHNLLQISARKSLNLSSRMMHTASKSLRDRLLSYLSEQSIEHDSNEFDIPFNRQQLADYLGVDRSAMSNELSKMQREGLISYKKSHFILLE